MPPSSSFDPSLYSRPRRSYDPTKNPLIFQLLECEDASKDKPALTGVEWDAGNGTLIRLHGVAEDGVSICVLVRGVEPYLFFPVSPTFRNSDIPRLVSALPSASPPLSATLTSRTPLLHYRPNSELYSSFLRLSFASTTAANAAVRVLGEVVELERGMLGEMRREGLLYDATVYENGLALTDRVMVDMGVVGAGWVRIPNGRYQVLKVGGVYGRYGVVVGCEVGAVEGLSPTSVSEDAEARTERWSHLAPLRCACLSALFIPAGVSGASASSVPSTPRKTKVTTTTTKSPAKKKKKRDSDHGEDEEEEDFVAAITVILTEQVTEEDGGTCGCAGDKVLLLTHGSGDNEMKNLKMPGLGIKVGKEPDDPCATDDANEGHMNVIRFSSEREMLQGLHDLIISYDPDILTGYDLGDTLSLLLTRATAFNLPSFATLSRPSSIQLKPKTRQVYSASWVRSQRRMVGTSNREQVELGVVGRWVLDLRLILEREERMRTYSLQEASEMMLGHRLERFGKVVLGEMWRKGRRERLERYIAREARVGLGLMRKGQVVVSAVEMARVCGINLNDVVSKGQMRRLYGQLFRFCGARGIVVPSGQRYDSQMTEGPVNWMPRVGYDMENPVIVLDFRSLYPSILISRNLCYSTLLASPSDLPESDYTQGYGPTRCFFAKPHVKEGIVPLILRHFLSQRRKVKEMMNATADPVVRAVLDGRQKSLKVVANAMYGFTGAKESKLQCLPLAETTIVTGGLLLEEAKRVIESKFNVEGEGKRVEVVYGDTDSCFVKVYGMGVAEAVEFGKRMAGEVSEVWDDPVQLEFENVLFPSLLVNRKRYAGLSWTKAEDANGIEVKGLEANRRDAVPLIADLMGEVLNILLQSKKRGRNDVIEEVKESVRSNIKRIANGEFDIGKFIMTKGLWLGTEAADYKTTQPHIAVIDKIRKRNPSRTFKDGERIPYVFIAAPANAKGFEKAEDPEWAMKEGLNVDYEYYLEHTVRNPLSRILELLMERKEVDELFKVKVKSVPKVGGTGMMSAFLKSGAKTLARCVVCGEQAKSGKKLCCAHQGQSVKIGEGKREAVKALEVSKERLFDMCRVCQGDGLEEVMCTNLDCSIYFQRKRALDKYECEKEDAVTFYQAQDLSW
ncbi:hypothetical protein SAICODRAFT_9289 [Saitoella complicata NRRL Y-17804]|uniref:DNA polymerase n=1 Tax=Saitoella complicata (strain BCRC 22490 / CBS 7301 / JCM 7358 / NBRC 10748 / NRRL Y-17804) TaxID=698492 RepID=A0A0E9NII6_SAICN|nr:uncharacterized protein SAICODRAFT_9289 [Saitoella complicata NRRL Y-17804]ODQ50959.1 hypothetical protein SAICODRAFT_9289 [Saitoella complicata NRRL Y-17804]GAO49659.1 hypothetical protein G7K_3807-t1 [Saitoella complicata NRRL Y-17804]